MVGRRGGGVRLTQSLICITPLSRWVSVFTRTLCLLLLFAHIYSGTLQQGGTNWTPDEIGSASYPDRLDKAKPAWPLNKHLQPLFGLLHELHPWRANNARTHFPKSASRRMPLHSIAQLRRRMPWQVKPLTCVWVRTSPVECIHAWECAWTQWAASIFISSRTHEDTKTLTRITFTHPKSRWMPTLPENDSSTKSWPCADIQTQYPH